MQNKEHSPYTLSSVDNALRLIDVLCKVEEIGVSELAREMELGKGTVFKLLMTLKGRGYIRKNEENNKYRLGIKFAYVGNIVQNRHEIIKYSRPFLEELTYKFNEATHLVIMEDDGHIRFLDKVNGSSFVHMESMIGGKKESYCTGTGKAILANMDQDKLDVYLKRQSLRKLTDKTITDIDELSQELEKIKAQGYAIDDEESELGLVCYAAPIYSISGKVIAAISLSGPASRMKVNRCEMIKNVVKTSEKISKSIR